MKPSTKKVLFRLAWLLVWVFGGAWLFTLIEEKEYDDRSVKEQMKELHRSRSSELNMTFAEFENLSDAVSKILTASGKRWTYKNAVEFAFHTVTTIGYGYITPTTPSGQVFCIIYALTGIPISMLALKSVGGLIAEGFTVIIRRVEKRFWNTAEPTHVEIKCTVVTFLATIVFLVITISVQMHLESLTPIEATYLWVISLTTVGYGDYYPGKNISLKDLNAGSILFVEIFGILFYLVGLCFVSSVLNAIASAIERRRCRGRCLRCSSIPSKFQIKKYLPESVEISDDELRSGSTRHADQKYGHRPESAVENYSGKVKMKDTKRVDQTHRYRRVTAVKSHNGEVEMKDTTHVEGDSKFKLSVGKQKMITIV